MDTTHTPLDRELTEDEAADIARCLMDVPVVALPHGGMGKRPTHWDDVLVAINSMGDYLKKVIQENAALREAARIQENDLATVRRVLGTDK